MTKSGIGTQNSQSNVIGTMHGQTAMTNGSTSTATTSNNSNATNVANAEIPIWVADKKKWVTGISKKTTVNDLIYAILKQCQLVGNASSNQVEQIANQYVLVEYQFEPDSSNANMSNNTTNANQQPSNSFVMTSQRIYNGDSKVYKYLNKWSQTTHSTSSLTQATSASTNSNSNIMLKILQRESNSNELAQSNANEIDTNNHNHHSSSSLASKLLKKFGVSSNNSSTTTTTTSTNGSSANNSNNTTSKASTSNSYRYVDVKLPQQQQQPQPQVQTNSSSNLPAQSNQIVSPSSTSTLSSSTHNTNNHASKTAVNQYDPNVQKAMLFNSIVEKENRLKQQIDRFQLIDELIKETEKKSKQNVLSSCTNNVLNQLSLQTPQQTTTTTTTTTASSSSPCLSSSSTTAATASLMNNLPTSTTNENGLQTNLVDLNDIYCYFPEMCTHHLKEVEDFTAMCGQLFNLDEAIKSQKQLLNSLEFDLQRELNQQQHQQQQQQVQSQEPTRSQSALNMLNESPETIELRQEVYMSREQTRLQCKQLHDLDLRMRQSEQSLMLKEQQLQQLLEELYIQEIYADNALESVINQNVSNVMPVVATNLTMYRSPNSHVDLRELNTNQESDSNDQQPRINTLTPMSDDRHTPFQHQLQNDVSDNIPMNNLNAQQKSHSIGNLTCLNSNQTTNNNVNMKTMNQTNGHIAQMLNAHNTNFANTKKLLGNNGTLMKPSPSLELNHLTNRTASIKINNQLNAHSQHQQTTHQPNNDQSGDNDSGISSMSSETTAAMNTAASVTANAAGTGIPIIVQQNVANTRSNVVTPNQMHMGNQHYQSKQMLFNANINQHQQYLTNQYQQHHNMMMLNNPTSNAANNQTSKAASAKSVLETLV